MPRSAAIVLRSSWLGWLTFRAAGSSSRVVAQPFELFLLSLVPLVRLRLCLHRGHSLFAPLLRSRNTVSKGRNHALRRERRFAARIRMENQIDNDASAIAYS